MRRADMLRVGPLNAALTEVTESFAGLVLASGAGHMVSPLAFCGETSQNTFGSEAWVTPRFGLAPPTARTADGVFSQVLWLWWRSGHGLSDTLCARIAGRFAFRSKVIFSRYAARREVLG